MNLEIISKYPEKKSSLPPVLMVHGGWHGAWCWEDNFLEYFAACGWETHALSLRGHGNSEGRKKLHRWSLTDYSDDIKQAISGFKRAPLLIGHSMGSIVVQKYLETANAVGAVLLAPPPRTGLMKPLGRMLKSHLLTGLKGVMVNSYYFVKDPDHVREYLFSPEVSQEKVNFYQKRLQSESRRASVDLINPWFLKPHKVNTPVAVLGGQNDMLIYPSELEEIAQSYNIEPKVFPMAHNLMSDPGWEEVALWVDKWGRGLADA